MASTEIDEAILDATKQLFASIWVAGAVQSSPLHCEPQERDTYTQACKFLSSANSFVVASTLYSRWSIEFIVKAKAAGYRIGLIYASSDSTASSLSSAAENREVRANYYLQMKNLNQVSRLADEFLVYDRTPSDLDLLGHSLKGLPRVVHPFPKWLESLRLPGLATTNELRRAAEDARTAVLRKIQDLGCERVPETARLDREHFLAIEDTYSVLSYLCDTNIASNEPLPTVLRAVRNVPNAHESIVDWCARSRAVSELNRVDN